MPCHAAMIEKPLVIAPDTSVEAAIVQLKARGSDCAAVVSAGGVLEGVFSIQELMKNLLPVSVAMADGIQLDVTVRAAPGVAKRLRKVMPLPVSEFMNRKPLVVYPQTPIWEGINILVTQGGPLAVVEGENSRFMGLITDSSLLNELLRMQEGDAL